MPTELSRIQSGSLIQDRQYQSEHRSSVSDQLCRFPLSDILFHSLLKLFMWLRWLCVQPTASQLYIIKMVWIPVPWWKVSIRQRPDAFNKPGSIMLAGVLWDAWRHPDGWQTVGKKSIELSICTSCSNIKWFQIWSLSKSSFLPTAQIKLHTHTQQPSKNFHGLLYGTFRSLQW